MMMSWCGLRPPRRFRDRRWRRRWRQLWIVCTRLPPGLLMRTAGGAVTWRVRNDADGAHLDEVLLSCWVRYVLVEFMRLNRRFSLVYSAVFFFFRAVIWFSRRSKTTKQTKTKKLRLW